MILLHLRKQICMEGGCMLGSVDLMNWIPELIAFVLPIIKEDVNILIKASRFMRFETIVDALTKIKY